MKTMIFGCLLLPLLFGNGRFDTAQNTHPINIPFGKEITIDGKLLESEWSDALRQNLTGGGELFLKHDSSYLYVGIRGLKYGWGHVYIPSKKDINVFHASAALGKAIYTRERATTWEPRQTFAWSMRDTSLSETAQQEREAFLRSNGWVANTNRMGNGSTLEYKIALTNFEEAVKQIAVMYSSNAKSPQYWPSTIKDDCLHEELITGNTPSGLHFETSQWVTIEFSPPQR